MVYELAEDSVDEETLRTVYKPLSPEGVSRLKDMIQRSGTYHVGKYGHIFNESEIVGFISNDNVDLLEGEDDSLREDHASLLDMIFASLI